jgi:hypothetical protein
MVNSCRTEADQNDTAKRTKVEAEPAHVFEDDLDVCTLRREMKGIEGIDERIDGCIDGGIWRGRRVEGGDEMLGGERGERGERRERRGEEERRGGEGRGRKCFNTANAGK